MVLLGCQSQPSESTADQQASNQTTIKPMLQCGGMPPLRDRSKLTENLRTKGLISGDMDQAQIDKVVADYIAKRQKAFEKCHKPTPS